MAELSPAAQAVLDAVDALYEEDIPEDRRIMAATLRAAADQMIYAGADEAATWLTEIAAELEGA